MYLQVVLGFDAFETGKRLFPLSVALLLAALTGPRLAARLAPKRVCQAGLVALTIAAFFLVGTIDVELNDTGFAIALAVFGIGAGLLLSQLGNVIMSSVDQSKSNEAGGLQGTAQNLGASLGTALIGAVLISGLTTGFISRIENNPAVTPAVQAQLAEAVATGIPVVPVDDVEQALLDADVPPAEATAVAKDYGDAQLEALKKSLLAVALLAAASLWFTRRLPGAAPTRRAADRLPPGGAGLFVDWPRGADRARNRGRRPRPGVQEGAARRRRDRARGRPRRDLRLPRPERRRQVDDRADADDAAAADRRHGARRRLRRRRSRGRRCAR